MPDNVITSVDQVTPAWLTAALRRSGALAAGVVTAFEVDTGRGNWSTSARLRLQYTPDARGDRPLRLFLKLVNTDLDDEFFGPSEVAYYTRDYVDVPAAPLLRCYDARFSAAQQRYHLLLDDVSHSHMPASEQTPTLEYGLALAEGLATLHARWWGAARLARAQAPIHDDGHVRRFVAIAAPGADHIIPYLAGELLPHWPAIMSNLFIHLPGALIARARDAGGFTLIHGDVGCTNVLAPREGARPLYIIDRQPFDWSLTTWLGVYDLAYAMVLDWDIDLRRRLEEPVLRHYHARLAADGVDDYPWPRLWDDYRLSVALCVTIAVEYCRGGVNHPVQWVWQPMLQQALTACDDLQCAQLWTE